MTTLRRDNPPAGRGSPATYRATVDGHLDDHWASWLGAHTLVRNDDATTALTAVDQAQLHGVLAGIRDLGVRLLSVLPVDAASEPRPTPKPALGRPLRTPRLTLRAAAAGDAATTWAYRRLDSVNQWLTGRAAGLPEYRAMFVEPSRLAATVIAETADDTGTRVIGDFMLRVGDAWSQAEVSERATATQAELGWVLAPAHTGHGYATETVRELLRYCFEELTIHRVVANCFLDNDTSWRLMERVGMRRETHAVRESLHRSGRWLDTVGYAVLDDEWNLRASSGCRESGEP